MNQYEECINSMWEEIEGKRPKAEGRRTEQDRWKELKRQFYGTNTIVFTEWGTIDFDPERVKEIENASNITYDEYLEIMRTSGRNK